MITTRKQLTKAMEGRRWDNYLILTPTEVALLMKDGAKFFGWRNSKTKKMIQLSFVCKGNREYAYVDSHAIDEKTLMELIPHHRKVHGKFPDHHTEKTWRVFNMCWKL